MARERTGRPVGKPKAGNPIYPIAVEGILDSAMAIRSLIEEAQQIARMPGQRPTIRAAWTQAADELEEALDALLDCCRRQAQAHQREVFRAGEGAACRLYPDNEPSAGSLATMGKLARKAHAARGCTGCGQCAEPAPGGEMVSVAVGA
jgi:hypothetical protein